MRASRGWAKWPTPSRLRARIARSSRSLTRQPWTRNARATGGLVVRDETNRGERWLRSLQRNVAALADRDSGIRSQIIRRNQAAMSAISCGHTE
jgi:hypothetical protein